MTKVPSSAPPPNPPPPTKAEKPSPQVLFKVWTHFVKGIAQHFSKHYIKGLFKNETKGIKIRNRSIEPVTMTEKSLGELFALAKAHEYEENGQIIKAIWLRAKVSQKLFTPPPDEQVQRLREFRFLAEGGEGSANLVFKGVAGPLEVKKRLNSGVKPEAQIALLKRLDHPNIIKISPNNEPGPSGEDSFMMKNGGIELTKLLPTENQDQDPDPFPQHLFISIAEQMADVLCYLKEERVLHRDIKLGNILIDQTGHISLIDFGMAFDCKTGTFCHPNVGVGTPSYMEPDALKDFSDGNFMVSDSGDMFAAGQTLYALITGNVITFPKFNENNGPEQGEEGGIWENYKRGLGLTELIDHKISTALKGQPQEYIDQVKDLLARMLEPDSKLRITPKEMKNHPLFSGRQPPS